MTDATLGQKFSHSQAWLYTLLEAIRCLKNVFSERLDSEATVSRNRRWSCLMTLGKCWLTGGVSPGQFAKSLHQKCWLVTLSVDFYPCNMLGLPGGLARKFHMWGGGGVGVGMQSRFWKLHTCWMLRHCNVGVWTFRFLCKHGTLLVCSCVHMVRCWCVMCRLGWGWGGDAITFLEVAHMLHATPRQRWCVNFRFFMYTWYVKQHAWQIVSIGYAVNYRWLLIFPPDLAKKTDVWTLSKHSMINCIWKHDVQSTSEKKHILYGKTQ